MGTKEIESNSYLTFKLCGELFASHVSKVLNILEMLRITQVPKSPAYMKGVINLRGNVLPVIDIRIKFGMPAIEVSKDTVILVLSIEMENEQINVGALVDSVQEVIEVGKQEILPSPSIGSKYRSEFIQGMIKSGEQFIMLLDMDKVFSTNDLILIQESSVENIEEEKANISY